MADKPFEELARRVGDDNASAMVTAMTIHDMAEAASSVDFAEPGAALEWVREHSNHDTFIAELLALTDDELLVLVAKAREMIATVVREQRADDN